MESIDETRFRLSEKQVERLVNDMEKVKKSLWEDNGDEMGLIPRVRQNTEMLRDIKKLAWVILGAVVSLFIALIYQLAVTHPMP